MPNLTLTRRAQYRARHAVPLHPLANWRGGRGVRFALLSAVALALLLASLTLLPAPAEAQGSWTCTYDFSTGSHGWGTATYAAGSPYQAAGSLSGGAWTTGDFVDTGFYMRALNIGVSFASTTITDVSMSYSFTKGTYVPSSPGAYGIIIVKAGSTTVIGRLNQETPPSSPATWSGSVSGVTTFGIMLAPSIRNDGSYGGGSASISSITLQGTGTSPCPATPTPGPSATPSNTPTPAPPTPTATPSTVSVTYDFTTGQHGWIPDNAVTGYSAGTGFVSTGTTTETWAGETLHRRPTQITLCTENQVKVMSTEMFVSFPGASYGNHNWSVAMWDGDIAGGAGSGNLDTGTDLTRTLTDGALMPHASLTFHINTSDPPVGTNYTTLNGDVDGSSYIIQKLIVTYATGYTPSLCDSSSPPTVTLTCPTGDLSQNITYQFEAETTGTVTLWGWDFGDGNTSSEADGLVEFSWPMDGTYTVEVEVSGPGGSDSDSCEVTILRTGDPGGGGGALYRPLSQADQDTELYDDGLFSPNADFASDSYNPVTDNLAYGGPDGETVMAISKAAGNNVYAVADGTVLAIDPVTYGNCGPVKDATLAGGFCQLDLWADRPTLGPGFFVSLSVAPGGLYRVRVSYTTIGVMEYYVRDAPTYVRVGQVLLAGCIVGLTSDFTNVLQEAASDVASSMGVDYGDLESRGITWLHLVTETDGESVQVPIIAQLYVWPNPDTACNAGGDYANCLFDPLFQNQGAYQWTVQGGVTWGDGVTLAPGSSISLQGLTLDAATAYSFTVWTERPRNYSPTDARLTLGIGTTETSFFLSESIRSPWAIASATHTADQGSLYSVRIINSGRAPFTVLQNCVTNGEPDTAPGSCYFQNYTFDGQLTSWATTGTVIPDPSGPLTGQIAVMSDLATLGQNVTLYADGGGGDHEYTVTLEGVLHGTGTSFFQVRYRFGSGGWVTPSVTGWNISEQSLSAGQRTKMISFDVPSGTFSGVMEFQFDFTATGGDVIGDDLWLSVYSLCLGDAAGFGHHPGGGGSNWTPGMGCDTSAPPVELQDDFGAWISYHFDGMSDIYYCDVIPQLERLNNVTYSIYEFGQWTGLYSQAAQNQVSVWADRSLFPWLGGHLSNIARAAGGAIGVDVGGGCHDIFCLLESIVSAVAGPIVDMVGRIVDTILGLINTAVDVLLPLVEAIVGFFVQVIGALGGLINSLITAITAFVTGISNAQPAPVPGLPNCAIDPSGSAICAVMYGLENTVFADEGAAIIPLFIGILAIVQLQWLISKLGELIERVTGGI